MHPVAHLLLGLSAIVLLAGGLAALAARLGQPPVVGEILAGILLGPTVLGAAGSGWVLSASTRSALTGLANVGLALFMFVTGCELDRVVVRGGGRAASAVAIGSTAVPFGLGVALGWWLAPRHDVVHRLPFVLFIGAAMSVTAFPVLARILRDRGLHRHRVGTMALASAAVSDVLAWCALVAITALAGASDGQAWRIFLLAPYLAVMVFVVRPGLRRLVGAARHPGAHYGLVAVVLAGLFASSACTDLIGLHLIFGAFAFGFAMPNDERVVATLIDRLGDLVPTVLLPVFFVTSALAVDLRRVTPTDAVDFLLIVAVAIGGKFVGTALGAAWQRLAASDLVTLAVLMNTRGLTEIVILTVGLQARVIDSRLFTDAVLMALVTTAMTGPLLRRIRGGARPPQARPRPLPQPLPAPAGDLAVPHRRAS
jgi:Kef-type K+ transport system membrane component KefB